MILRSTRLVGVFGAALVVGSGLGFSGCSGSSGSSSSPSPLPTPSTAPPRTSAPTGSGSPSVGGAALARSINLRQSDFPSGWKATAPSGGQGFQELLACLHIPTSSQIADVPSPNFSLPGTPSTSGGIEASSEVIVQSSPAAAQTDFGALSGPSVPGCVQSILSKAATSTPVPGGGTPSVTVVAAPAPVAGGNPAAGYQVTITVQSQGQTVTAGQGTLTFFAHGRVVVELDTLTLLGQTFPAGLQDQLVSVLAGRANASGR